MTVAPRDLADWRVVDVIPLTGLPAGEVGMLPDAAHKASGGYHCGCQDIIDIGTYPDGDYSTRQSRDRVGGNTCSAMDIGDDWPRGGRPAWLRFNVLLVAQMSAHDPALVALRGINFSPDGLVKRRYDSLHPEAGVIASTDTVLWHTHLEWWRDTADTPARARCLTRMSQIIRAAISNTPLPRNGDPMATIEQADWDALKWRQQALIAGLVDVAGGPTTGEDVVLVRMLRGVEVDVAELKARPAPVPTDEQMDALGARLEAVLAAKLADVVVAALQSPEGQAAIVTADNIAEDV